MASAEKHHGKYRGRYRCDGTCPRALAHGSCRGHTDGLSGFPTAKAARDAAVVRENEVRRRGFFPAAKNTLTLGDAAQQWLESDREGVKISTVRWYRNQFRALINKYPSIGVARVAKISTADIDGWLRDLRDEGLSKSSLRGYSITLRLILEYARKSLKAIVVNPADDATLPRSLQTAPREVSPFSEAELWAVADAVDTRYRLLILLGGIGGLRISELFGLQDQDIEQTDDGVLIRVARQYRHGLYSPTKTSKDRVVPVPPNLVMLLHKHRLRFPPSETRDQTVFAVPSGPPLHYDNFRNRVWYPALEACGLSRRGTHALRHTFATLALDKGIPVEVVADWGGWADVRMVWNVYRGKSDPAKLQAAARQMAATAANGVDLSAVSM